MSDENKPSQAEAVGEPLNAGHSQLAAAVEPAEGVSDASATQVAVDVENSPLGAYRRDRVRARMDARAKNRRIRRRQ